MTPLGGKRLIVCTRYRHGLGNRIRVVLGGRVLARAEGREFAYVWPTGAEFGPRLTELWDVDFPSVPLAVSRALSLRYPYRDASLQWIDDSTRRSRLWQVQTSQPLELAGGAGGWQPEFRSLAPVAPVANRIRTFFHQHLTGAPYVGVMIRAHSASHEQTLEASPIQWYLQRMREIRAESPEVTFFVSADVPSAGRQLVAEIGNCWMLEDKGAYNSVAGVQSSVTDLYLLAGSGYLLGPHYSSFVELAQFLAGSGLVLETSRTAVSKPTDYRSLGTAEDPTMPSVRLPG